MDHVIAGCPCAMCAPVPEPGPFRPAPPEEPPNRLISDGALDLLWVVGVVAATEALVIFAILSRA